MNTPKLGDKVFYGSVPCEINRIFTYKNGNTGIAFSCGPYNIDIICKYLIEYPGLKDTWVIGTPCIDDDAKKQPLEKVEIREQVSVEDLLESIRQKDCHLEAQKQEIDRLKRQMDGWNGFVNIPVSTYRELRANIAMKNDALAELNIEIANLEKTIETQAEVNTKLQAEVDKQHSLAEKYARQVERIIAVLTDDLTKPLKVKDKP